MNGAATYVYDPVGNRTQKTSTLPGYPGGLSNYNANDQLSTDTYDANGNTTASTGQGYVYDFENHLIQAGGATYTYDGDGNRMSKTVAGVTTHYIVDPQSPTGYPQVVQEWPSPGTLMGYAYGLEQISRQRTYYDYTHGQWVNEQVYYVHDGHGSVRALTDATGAVTDTYDYDAFGNLLNSTFTGSAATPNNYLFAGEQFDPDLGLYYNRARYLNTSTGRFWTMDTDEGTQEAPASLHSYLYASANPVDLTDPSGHEFGVDALAVLTTINTISIPNLNSVLLAVNEALDKEPLSGGARTEWLKYQGKAQNSVYNPDCIKCLALVGQTPAAMAAEIAAQIAWDGTVSKIKLAAAGLFSYNWSTELARNYKPIDLEVQEWFSMHPKARAAVAMGNHGSHAHEVYFSHNFTQITVIHEALHWLTFMDDEALAKALGSGNRGSPDEYSEYISTKLSDSHCDKEPK